MREKAKELLTAAMLDALNADIEASDLVALRVKEIEEAMEHVREITGALPKRLRSGATNVDVEVNELVLAPLPV